MGRHEMQNNLNKISVLQMRLKTLLKQNISLKKDSSN